jgi:mannose-6-phosphate isomerase-like protein (cupin superfamily)
MMPQAGVHMTDFSKGFSMVLGPDDGESFWQPLPSVGYATNKITPYNSPHDLFSMGIQVLEPGAHIRRHAHVRAHEVLFCYAGTGEADIDGKHYDVVPETLLLMGRGAVHKISNTGKVQMRLLWGIWPAGLEDWFSDIGRPRRPGEPMPPPFQRPHNIDQIEAMARLAQLSIPDDD